MTGNSMELPFYPKIRKHPNGILVYDLIIPWFFLIIILFEWYYHDIHDSWWYTVIHHGILIVWSLYWWYMIMVSHDNFPMGHQFLTGQGDAGHINFEVRWTKQTISWHFFLWGTSLYYTLYYSIYIIHIYIYSLYCFIRFINQLWFMYMYSIYRLIYIYI